MGAGWRLAVGLLTAVPVRPRWRRGAATPPEPAPDRSAGRAAMLWAPAVGGGLGVAAALVLLAARWLVMASAALPAALAVLALALLTRGLHLDGLADTVDGLGARGDRDRRLAVMRASDVGAFGVAAVVFALLLDTAALSVCITDHRGVVSLVAGAVTARLALTWACREGVPAARPDGLGALVAGAVPGRAAVAVTVPVLAGAAAAGWFDDRGGWGGALHVAVAVLAGLLAAEWVRRRAGRVLGGVTGDVFGAAAEVTALVTWLVCAAGTPTPHW